jgi:hypothetical protein
VLQAELPAGLTETMREVAFCLFAAMALMDSRAGQERPGESWLAVLRRMARVALAQLQYLSNEMGGQPAYLAKGVAVFLSERDRRLCAEFRGNNYDKLARQYGLTEMRVRQIVGAWQAEQYRRRQGRLPGLDAEG